MMIANIYSESARLLFEASGATVELFIGSCIAGTVLGLFLVIGRLAKLRALNGVSWIIVWFFRGVPALVLLFFAFYGLPQVGIRLSPIEAGIAGLGVSAAAYNAEIFRGAILSVSKGQWEASRALGLTEGRIWFRIVLPQSLRIATPAYMSNAITLMKSTSLASVITVVEITGEADRLISSTYDPLQVLLVASIAYLILNSILSGVQVYLERVLKLRE